SRRTANRLTSIGTTPLEGTDSTRTTPLPCPRLAASTSARRRRVFEGCLALADALEADASALSGCDEETANLPHFRPETIGPWGKRIDPSSTHPRLGSRWLRAEGRCASSARSRTRRGLNGIETRVAGGCRAVGVRFVGRCASFVHGHLRREQGSHDRRPARAVHVPQPACLGPRDGPGRERRDAALG